MIGKCLRSIRRHPWRSVLTIVLLLFVLLNVLAFFHAYAMTHFVDCGEKTGSPHALSFWQKGKVLLTGVRMPKPVNSATPADLGMAFTVCNFRGPSGIDYEAWHISSKPSRGLCIMFHGYATCKSSLLSEAGAWHDLGYDALLVDFRGCGGSSGRVTTIGYCEADDVAAAVDYARRELAADRPVLYGQSMGSVAILRAVAARGVEPRAVVVECPYDRLLSTTENRCRLMGVPAFPCAHLLVFWGGVQHGYSGFSLNPVEYAEGIRCPVLLMQGDRDPYVKLQEAQDVFDHLAGPNRMMIFENVGHESYLRREAERWRQSIAEFLAK